MRGTLEGDEILHVLRKVKKEGRKLNMNSSQKNLNIKEDIEEIQPDELDYLEDDLLAKKKVRIKSKYSEKRYIP